VFDGEANEDPRIAARLRAELIRDNDALLADKARRAEDQAAAERAYAASVAAATATADALDAQLKGEHRLDTGIRLVRENAAMVRERRRREEAERALDEDERQQEAAAVRADAMLAEGREQCFDARDGSRPRKDHFKGFSVEDIAGMRAEQEQQRQDNAARRLAEAKAKKAQDNAVLAACAAADAMQA